MLAKPVAASPSTEHNQKSKVTFQMHSLPLWPLPVALTAVPSHCKRGMEEGYKQPGSRFQSDEANWLCQRQHHQPGKKERQATTTAAALVCDGLQAQSRNTVGTPETRQEQVTSNLSMLLTPEKWTSAASRHGTENLCFVPVTTRSTTSRLIHLATNTTEDAW